MAKVVIIEDDASVSMLYSKALQEKNFTVVTCPDGESGIAQIRKDYPDVVLLDIMLAGKINGFDVLEELKSKRQTKNIPVIVITNLSSEEETARKMGVADFLNKRTLNIESIVNKVTELS